MRNWGSLRRALKAFLSLFSALSCFSFLLKGIDIVILMLLNSFSRPLSPSFAFLPWKPFSEETFTDCKKRLNDDEEFKIVENCAAWGKSISNFPLFKRIAKRGAELSRRNKWKIVERSDDFPRTDSRNWASSRRKAKQKAKRRLESAFSVHCQSERSLKPLKASLIHLKLLAGDARRKKVFKKVKLARTGRKISFPVTWHLGELFLSFFSFLLSREPRGILTAESFQLWQVKILRNPPRTFVNISADSWAPIQPQTFLSKSTQFPRISKLSYLPLDRLHN